MHLLPPPPEYWYTRYLFFFFWQAQVTYTKLRMERVCGVIHRGRVTMFSSPIPALNLPCVSNCSSTFFLSTGLALLSVRSFTFALDPPKTPLRTAASLLGFLLFLPYFLLYALPSYSSSPFRYFIPYDQFHTTRPAMAGNLFFGMLLTSHHHFNNLSSLRLFQAGTFPVLLLILQLLVVFEHSSSF